MDNATQLLNPRDIEFILYEYLNTQELPQRSRYQEHSKEDFDAVLDISSALAQKHFANHNQKGDQQEPQFDGEKVQMIPETKVAWDALAEVGLLALHRDFEEGGSQMPEVIMRTSMAYLMAANVASSGYSFLTIGAANLIHSFASQEHKDKYLPPMQDGRFAGTMALTEPAQGSALADIKTTAKLQDDGSYRLFGQKMYISGGDQSITENIVHLVLAKIEGAPAGVKGISLFICPKILVNDDGRLGERNDVALAGLLHKMGYRNTTSTVLNFGEKEGAVAYLVGEPHRGLSYMFQMMNEARIGVGLGAACLGYQGYNYSLNYARERPQGRKVTNKDPLSPQVKIIEHADVRRMLLMQKAYVEGSLALCLYASQLHEDTQTAQSEEAQQAAHAELSFLTSIVKSYPSKYCLKANELAIQVLGGSGYIREYPVEQYYRDNRLNPIHEGTEGIQGLDLLGRQLPAQVNKALPALLKKMHKACSDSTLTNLVDIFQKALAKIQACSSALLGSMAKGEIEASLANASLYLDAMGRLVVAWIWLDQANIAQAKLANLSTEHPDHDFYQGKVQAARYFIEWELPEIHHLCQLLTENNPVCLEMRDEWF